MPKKAAKKSKRDALKRHGTLNPHPRAVTDPLFETGDFFDRDDTVQGKYEMLRRVTLDKQSVTQSATAFGFSRPTYYQAEADFQQDGLFGLLPEKRGPRQGHKLTSEVLDLDRKSTRLNSSHLVISYAVFCLKKKKKDPKHTYAPKTRIMLHHLNP